MSVKSRLWAWYTKLPPAEDAMLVKKGVPIPMPDGVTLLANHYLPQKKRHCPTILIRTPYGRANWSYLGELFAERGFQVLLQSVRGTDGSEGTFDPFRQERADGLATVAWIKQQEWFSGDLAMYGSSYLGHAQWAIADEAGPELQAMAAQFTSPDLRRAIYPGGSLSLDIFLQWSTTWGVSRGKLSFPSVFKVSRKLPSAYHHLPLCEADRVACGQSVPFWQAVLEHENLQDEWWQAQNGWDAVKQIHAQVQLLGGWYDFFLPDMVKLYSTLRHAGHHPQLIIGPWAHGSARAFQHDAREALAWFRAHLLHDQSGLRSLPVCIYVMGARQWREYAEWPPSGTHSQAWYLHAKRGLTPDVPVPSDPDQYCYDPAHPTPAVGGIGIVSNFGPKDQRKLEKRADVLTYTSPPLLQDLEVIGPVQVELYVRSSLAQTDFFACLCDMAPSGKSINITSALVRVHEGAPAPSPDGSLRVCMDLWPTAYRFRRSNRLRLQVSSGAHPHFARNTGSGEPIGTATRLLSAEQQVYHDPEHPSAVILPVVAWR